MESDDETNRTSRFPPLSEKDQDDEEGFFEDSKTIIHLPEILSINNSADENNSKRNYRKLPQHQSSHKRQKDSSKLNMLSNRTRVTVRSMSNQNLNHAYSSKEQSPSNALGTINSHITVAPVESSRCQNMTSATNTLCRFSFEPLAFVNRGMCCGYCRPVFVSSMPCHHSAHCLPSSAQLRKSEPFPSVEEGIQSQSSHYSVLPNNQSQSAQSPGDEFISNDATPNSQITTEQNHSIVSFPEHDTSPSQTSEKVIDHDHDLKQKAQIIVDDSIQTAQEKYQKMLQMNTEQDSTHDSRVVEKPIVENQSKSALCEELCSKLNLSDANQITEIMRILASNAPNVLKELPPADAPSVNKGLSLIETENTLCGQLLLHPPFKPKRLIHLCPDGTIQVLSAVDENSKGNQIDTQQQYQLNYSNSALRPAITNESSFAIVNMKTNMLITESMSTEQSQSTNEIQFDRFIMDKNSILSIQQKKTRREYRNSSNLSKYEQSTPKDNENPIVEIDLDLNDETIDEKCEDDQNSLPEITFKRINLSEHSVNPERKETIGHRKIHRKSRHNRSRSHTNKKMIQTDS